ncbi:hypothetical protein VKS41_008519 [Umbelopsis sp. WA50703]
MKKKKPLQPAFLMTMHFLLQLLQREIANRKGIPADQPLLVEPQFSPKEHHSPHTSTSTSGYSSMASFHPGHDPSMALDCSSSISSTEEDTSSSSPLQKRKYRRHAKPDKNAPVKPPSAYVMFSNDVRKELKDYNMSFTELARIVGNRWKNIDGDLKEKYEDGANMAKDDYLQQLSEYQKTDEYKHYQKYLTDFRSKQDAAARAVGRPRKRVKTESPSSGSIADSSSNGNGNGNGNSHSSNGNSSNGGSSGYYSNGFSTNTNSSSTASSGTTPNFFTQKATADGRLSTARLAAQDAYYSRMAGQPSPNIHDQEQSVSTNADTPTELSSHADSEEPVMRPIPPAIEPHIQQHQSDVRNDDYDSTGADLSHSQPPHHRPSTPRMRRHKSFHLRH